VDSIVGGVIPNKFIPAVDKGVQEAMARGPIAGYPCVDFRCECFFGSYHDVDSSEQAFKMAGILAFRAVSPKARPVLLEPVIAVEVWSPSDILGDVLGDLSPRRAQILATEQDGRLTKINTLVPQAELYRYSTALHSITHGRGTHRERFHGYAEAPGDVAAKVSAEHKKETTGEES
jgi:elongation factor G